MTNQNEPKVEVIVQTRRGVEAIRREFPDGCPRDIKGCGPLHRIVSDAGDTYVCCGLHCSVEKPTPYRFCFVGTGSDTMYDHDELDMLDTIEVMSRALSTVRRLRDASAAT